MGARRPGRPASWKRGAPVGAVTRHPASCRRGVVLLSWVRFSGTVNVARRDHALAAWSPDRGRKLTATAPNAASATSTMKPDA